MSSCKDSFTKGNILSIVEEDNKDFSVRITAFREDRDFAQVLGGIDYIVEVNISGEPEWKEIMIVHHDDGVEFNKKNIIFVNPEVGFVYLAKKYAVTLDAGKHWTSFNIVNDDLSCMIKDAQLEKDGKGYLLLNCNNSENKFITIDLFQK